MMTAELSKFYNDYAAWLDAGAPEEQPFIRGMGLCNQVRWDLQDELRKQFVDAGLSAHYPFNLDGHLSYSKEAFSDTCHLNKARIKWVRDHAI